MAKRKFGYKLSQINRLRMDYDYLARDSEKKLKEIMDSVFGGTAPEEVQIQEFKKSVTKLRDEYNKICAITRERLSGSELPPEGSSVNDILAALSERNEADLTVCRKRALDLFKRFGMVWSADNYLLRQLSDQKEAASEYIEALNDPEVLSDAFTEIEDYEKIMIHAETFLKALDCRDLDSEEGIELLEKVSQLFSLDVATGLLKKKYCINC